MWEIRALPGTAKPPAPTAPLSPRALIVGREPFPPLALLERLELLEERHLPPRRPLDPGVDRAERGPGGRCEQRCAVLAGGGDGLLGVLALEGDAERRPVRARRVLDLVDGPGVRGARELERRGSGVQDRHPVLPVSGEGGLLG